MFDKIDNPDKIDVIFQENVVEDDEPRGDAEGSTGNLPANRDPVVIVDPVNPRTSPLVHALLENHVGAFKKVASDTTRQPKEGEVEGQDFHFVDVPTFNSVGACRRRSSSQLARQATSTWAHAGRQ